MKRIFLFLTLIISVVLSQDIRAQSSVNSTTNALVFTPNEERPGRGSCIGSLSPDILESVALKADDLKNGVECVAGDFDKNGFRDYALKGRTGPNLDSDGVQTEYRESQYLVILYGKSGVVQSEIVDVGAADNVFTLGRPKGGKFKSAQQDSLLSFEEGGWITVYMFNQRTKKFEKDSYYGG